MIRKRFTFAQQFEKNMKTYLASLLFTLSLSLSYNSCISQEMFWYDVHLEIPIENQRAAEELVVDYYSKLEIPEDVSAAFSQIPFRGEHSKVTHMLSFASVSSESLSSFRGDLSGDSWEKYLSGMEKLVTSARTTAGNALAVTSPEKSFPIGQVWIFNTKRKDIPAFTDSFSKLMKSFNFNGFAAMGEITHGNSQGENTFIYATYEDLNSALTFGPKNEAEQIAFRVFFDEVSHIEFSQSNTRTLIMEF